MATTTSKMGDKRTVHLVWGSDCGDAATLLKAFANPEAAVRFREACEAHLTAKPQPPSVMRFEDTPENQALYERWFQANERWKKRHPAGPEGWLFNTFNVTECEVESE